MLTTFECNILDIETCCRICHFINDMKVSCYPKSYGFLWNLTASERCGFLRNHIKIPILFFFLRINWCIFPLKKRDRVRIKWKIVFTKEDIYWLISHIFFPFLLKKICFVDSDMKCGVHIRERTCDISYDPNKNKDWRMPRK